MRSGVKYHSEFPISVYDDSFLGGFGRPVTVDAQDASSSIAAAGKHP
ncbi:hypothetical protein [Fodinibius sp.]